MSLPRPLSLDETLDQLEAALRAAEETQRTDGDPAHEDFYRWRAALTEITGRLGAVVHSSLAGQVADYGDRRVLGHDAGADPGERLGAAAGHLERLAELLGLAHDQARAFHAEIGEISVVVDPGAEPDPDTAGAEQ